MLALTLPWVDSWNAWYSWFGNSTFGYRRLRDQVDAACRAVDRNPATLERTVALLVALPGATGRRNGDLSEPHPEPIDGRPEALAEVLQAFAAEGVEHVQLVCDPITVESIQALEPMLARLDAG